MAEGYERSRRFYERLRKDTRGSMYYTGGSKQDTSCLSAIRAITKLYERLPGLFEWFVKEDTGGESSEYNKSGTTYVNT
ncbi:hypothetical protein NCCP2222_35670 [Sporosarcina sp. NCCP-2222]|uniref:hypothetical protein n=1 Tax=Sporosarcina sp. NCCP-2222 TaxID=2935073 RepID=UPI00207EF1B9|nr:hypothetical protein [Sporosarcina sp. NCCP-2222]GKV57620.1 hypothetical protein NCCP2222_35670 [Sporosarcina sp. NCCP-2222]